MPHKGNQQTGSNIAALVIIIILLPESWYQQKQLEECLLRPALNGHTSILEVASEAETTATGGGIINTTTIIVTKTTNVCRYVKNLISKCLCWNIIYQSL